MNQNKNKWFIEIVQDFNGTYYANMIKDGKRVEGLPEYVDYSTLRKAIEMKTGIQILKRKDLILQQSGVKKFAYIDNTRERSDCRVTLGEIRRGYRPDFNKNKEDMASENKTVYIPPKESHVLDFDELCILSGTIIGIDPAMSTESFSSAGNVKIHITGVHYLDGSEENVDQTLEYYEHPSLYTTSLEEAKNQMEKINEKVEKIKNFPKAQLPAGHCALDYFRVINIKALLILVSRDG